MRSVTAASSWPWALAGTNPKSAFGFPFDHRISRFSDALAIISSLLRTAPRPSMGGSPKRTIASFVLAGEFGWPPIMIGTIAARPWAVAGNRARR